MAKELKHVDKVYDVLVECREALWNKSLTLKKVNKICADIDRIIGER